MACMASSFPMKLSQTNLADWGSCVVPHGKYQGKSFEEVALKAGVYYKNRIYKSQWAMSLGAYCDEFERHKMEKHLFDFNVGAGGGDASRSGGGSDASRSDGGGDASRSGDNDSMDTHDKPPFPDSMPKPSWTELVSAGRRLIRKIQQAASSRSSGDAVNGGSNAVNGQDKHGGGGGVECDAVNGGGSGGGDAVKGGGGGVECDKHGGGDAVNGQNNDDGMQTIVLKIPHGRSYLRMEVS